MNKITCVICGTPVSKEEITNYAAYSGLPSPCCKICFEVRDYSDTSIDTIIEKSLKKRIQTMNGDFNFKEGEIFLHKDGEDSYNDWVVLEKINELSYRAAPIGNPDFIVLTNLNFMRKK